MSETHYDPVDGSEIRAGTEYASKDGVYFASLQTQQMFYTLVEKGFTVRFVDMKPALVKVEGQVLWKLVNESSTTSSLIVPRHSKDSDSPESVKNSKTGKMAKDGAYFKKKTDGKRIIPGLQPGDYVFSVELPELFGKQGKAKTLKNSKTLTVSLEVISGDGKEKITSFRTDLGAALPVFETKFTVWTKQNNATFIADYKAYSIFSKVLVKSQLVYYPLHKIKEEIMGERKQTKLLMKPEDGEELAELTKGAKGVGMTLGWNKELKCVLIKYIEPNGAASRVGKLQPGKVVCGINGKRLENVSFKEVIKRLRDVPRTVFLIIKPKPAGYELDLSAATRVKKLETFNIHSRKGRVQGGSVSSASVSRNLGGTVPTRSRHYLVKETKQPPPMPPVSQQGLQSIGSSHSGGSTVGRKQPPPPPPRRKQISAAETPSTGQAGQQPTAPSSPYQVPSNRQQLPQASAAPAPSSSSSTTRQRPLVPPKRFGNHPVPGVGAVPSNRMQQSGPSSSTLTSLNSLNSSQGSKGQIRPPAPPKRAAPKSPAEDSSAQQPTQPTPQQRTKPATPALPKMNIMDELNNKFASKIEGRGQAVSAAVANPGTSNGTSNSRATQPPAVPSRAPIAQSKSTSSSNPVVESVSNLSAATQSTVSTSSTTSAAPVSFQKYVKMKKSGLPEGAIFNAWMRDGRPAGAPAGFWSPEWEQQVNPQSGGQGTKKKLVIKKAAPKPVAATTGSEQRSTAQPAAKAQKPRNPMEELKGFNMSKLKRVVPKKEAPAASSAAPTNALVAALNDFHKKKATASAASQSHAPVETPVVQQTALKPSVTTPKPLSALDELKMFDRSKLKSAGNGTEAVSEDQPSQPTTAVGMHAAFSQALDNIREAVGNQSDSGEEEWDDNDDWAM